MKIYFTNISWMVIYESIIKVCPSLEKIINHYVKQILEKSVKLKYKCT